MARVYHTSIYDWLDMTLPQFFQWVTIADQMLQEERARTNVQNVGPGL